MTAKAARVTHNRISLFPPPRSHYATISKKERDGVNPIVPLRCVITSLPCLVFANQDQGIDPVRTLSTAEQCGASAPELHRSVFYEENEVKSVPFTYQTTSYKPLHFSDIRIIGLLLNNVS